MEHLVRFTTAEGRDGHHSAPNLEEALKFVEHMRNHEDVDDVRVFRLHEVPIEFKAYYKVEVRTGEPADAVNEPPPMPSAPPAGDESRRGDNAAVVANDAEEDAHVAGRRLFSRG